MNVQNDSVQYVQLRPTYKATLSKIQHYSYPGLLTNLTISRQVGRLHRDGKSQYTNGLFGVAANHSLKPTNQDR